MRHALYLIAATALAAMALGFTACGGDESDGGGADTSGNGRMGFTQDPDVAACLEKEGIELPERPQGEPPEGERPEGERPEGGPPAGGGMLDPESEEGRKQREAFEKCGVELPERPESGAQPEATPDQ